MEIKQVVVTGQNQVELQQSEIDDQNLGPNDIFVDTEYTFISAGTELANYTGKEPKVFQPGSWCAYPWQSGYANVGIVRAIASKQQMIFDWMERGELKIEPLISHRLKPEQIQEAYEGLLNQPETYTGVVLDWR